MLIKSLRRGARFPLLWVILGLTILLYGAMAFFTLPELKFLAGERLILDLRLEGYTLPEVQELFLALGTEGRHYYQWMQIPLDMGFALCFWPTLSLWMVFFLEKLRYMESKLGWISVLPLLGGISDLTENSLSFYLLGVAPQISEGIVQVASTITVIKSTLSTVSVLIRLICFGLYLYQRLKRA